MINHLPFTINHSPLIIKIMVYFLFKSAVCLAIFYGFYFLLLRKETFFHWNRFFLLSTAALSLLIPLLNIQINKEAKSQLPQLVERAQIAPQTVEYQLTIPITPTFSLSWGEVFGGLYICVAAMFGLLFLIKITRLWWLLKMSRKEQKDGFYLLETTDKNLPTASFFGFIFWKKDQNDDPTQQLILLHELAHVRGFHSVDVLLSEILIVFQWFNPMAWSLRRSLHSIHEYIADDWVVRNTCRRYDYALLLAQSVEISPPRLTNGFHSQLKNRLVMLSKSPSRPLWKVKYLLSLPIAAGLMLLFSFRLVEKIDLPKPLENAITDVNNFVEKMAEMPVYQVVTPELVAEKVEENATPMLAENTPYIFYWGNIEAKIQYLKATDDYFAEVSLQSIDLLRTYERVPHLYNGKSLEATTSFTFVTPTGERIELQSNNNDKELSFEIRKKFNALDPRLEENTRFQVMNLVLPNGKKAQISILIKGNRNESTEIKATTQSNQIDYVWGSNNRNNPRRPYYTFKEFWEIAQTSPKYVINGVEVDTVQADLGIVPKDHDPVEFRIDNTKSRNSKLRYERYALQSLKEHAHLIVPGTTIYLDFLNSPEKVNNSTMVGLVFKIVKDDSPLLNLKKADFKPFNFRLGKINHEQNFYGFSVKDNDGETIVLDQKYKLPNADLTINDLSQMLELKPQLWRDKVFIGTPRFTLRYRNFIEEYNPETGFSPEFIKNVLASLNKADPLEITNIYTEEWNISPVTLVFWPQ
jgi:hypothetical protein